MMMSFKPKFSIIIPTYNRAILLKRCLDSIIYQTVSDWEAIVVDNFSEDNTEEVVAAFKDKRIRYVKNHNYGIISISRNKALDLAKGDWICFLDSDDAWFPNKLESLIPYLNEYDLIYHGCRKDMKRIHPFQRLNDYFYEIKEPTVAYVIQRGDPICPSCSCVSRKIIGTTRFDESKELFAVEDYDFFLQLLHKGIRIKYLKKILTIYDMGGCSHGKMAIERDARLYKKWGKILQKQELEEVNILLKMKTASYLTSVGKLKQAQILYCQSLKSNIFQKKYSALKCLVKVWFLGCFRKI